MVQDQAAPMVDLPTKTANDNAEACIEEKSLGK